MKRALDLQTSAPHQEVTKVSSKLPGASKSSKEKPAVTGLFTSAPFRPGTSIHIKLQPWMPRFTRSRLKGGFPTTVHVCLTKKGFHTMHSKQVEKRYVGNKGTRPSFCLACQKE